MQDNKLTLSNLETERFYAYGFAHYEAGSLIEAADTFRVLCTKQPLDARFWFALGATLQEAKSYKDALNAWAMTALLEKENPYPHFHAAECFFSLQEAPDAQKALEEAENRIEPDHPLKGRIDLLKTQWGKAG